MASDVTDDDLELAGDVGHDPLGGADGNHGLALSAQFVGVGHQLGQVGGVGLEMGASGALVADGQAPPPARTLVGSEHLPIGTATQLSSSRSWATRDGSPSRGRTVPRLSMVWRASSSMAARFLASPTE